MKTLFKLRYAGVLSLLILSGILWFWQCKTEQLEVEKPLVSPPIKGLEPKPEVIQFDAGSGTVYKLKSGTEISIPANAFVDAEGKPVKGNVTVNYREFHDAATIFLSGIPMEYDNGGETRRFETAGMFDISAIQGSNKLELDSGKKINVKLASYSKADEYPFFRLDEKERNWQFLDLVKGDTNLEKVKIVEAIEKMKPAIEFPLGKEYFAFNFNGLLDVYLKEDYSKLYSVTDNEKKGIGNKAKQYGLTWTDIYTRTDVNFKGNLYPATYMVWKNLSKQAFPRFVINEQTRAELTYLGGHVYSMKVTSNKNQEFRAKIEVVMPLRSLFAFSPDYWKNNYQEAMEKIRQEEEKVKLLADVYRTFEVNKLGIYNYDRLIKEENAIVVQANFTYDKASSFDNNTLDMVYFIPDNGKSVFKYPKNTWDKFVFVPGLNGNVFTIVNGNYMARYTIDEWKKINLDALKGKTNPNFDFVLKQDAQPIKSADDVKKLMGI